MQYIKQVAVIIIIMTATLALYKLLPKHIDQSLQNVKIQAELDRSHEKHNRRQERRD